MFSIVSCFLREINDNSFYRLCTDSFCWWFDFANWWPSWQVVVKLNMDVELLCNMEMFWWDSFTDPDYGDTCFHCPTGVHSCPEPHSTQGCHFRNQQSQNFIKTWEIYFPRIWDFYYYCKLWCLHMYTSAQLNFECFVICYTQFIMCVYAVWINIWVYMYLLDIRVKCLMENGKLCYDRTIQFQVNLAVFIWAIFLVS